MKIVMFTNTYLPHVGGVANSVQQLAEDCRRRGHEVLIVAPEFPDMPAQERHVVRLRAIQNFNGSDFSVSLPAPRRLAQEIQRFQPDIVHTHHPYLLGDTALRVSATFALPLVFTHHTMYEDYTHYVPADSPQLKQFVIKLATGFANLCDQVITPSASIAQILKKRGVFTPITSIPTGVNCEQFTSGDGMQVRHQLEIPEEALLAGYVGRLAPEKNLIFLSKAVATFLTHVPDAHVLIVGDGASQQEMQTIFARAGVQQRVHFVGVQQGSALVDHYHAMNVFVFASKTETQGMVLAEAMAAGVPVIALDAPGVREIVTDRHNGRLLHSEESSTFADALEEMAALSRQEYHDWQKAALETAHRFSREASVEKMLHVYENLCNVTQKSRGLEDDTWHTLLREVRQEWDIWSNRIAAGVQAISDSPKSDNLT
ncbi:glycosyltransferase [candidate division KSB3 bacterium]|uniref:Glycosyltransferase n=1 Tax=candidate division KSB3 bacterium TaxID=2044937 RepID=A0A9D5K054_9BACT|nr:glycosyltransferase [candidate division KSB3 bacterium]MBD3327200.1 glycosyltransferase [candidate division KSB3 bacterium]